jgi:polyisoprenoid-binding protein YceI
MHHHTAPKGGFMRTIVFLFLVGLVTVGCKDPGAKVTPAAVESPNEPAAATQPGARAVQTLAINPSNSRIEFVGAKITASHDGGFTDFSGSLSVADPLEQGKVDLTIQTASLYADREKLTKHLKSPDFLDVDEFPTATFKSTKIDKDGNQYTVTGDLMLRGVTKRISFPASLSASADRLDANAEFSINRKDFGIVYPGMPDDLIRDLVVIKLSLSLPRQG